MLRFRTLGGAAFEGETGPIGWAAARRKSRASRLIVEGVDSLTWLRTRGATLPG